MAAPDINKIDRVPGLLIKNPTNLAAPPYYGGTVLGATRSVDADFMDRPSVNYAEEYKGAPVDMLEGPEWCILYATMREFDPDVVSTLFPKTTTGTSGQKVIHGSVSDAPRAGLRRSDRSFKLLFAPNEQTMKGMILYNAVPVIAEENRTAWSIFREQVLSASFWSLPDATKRTYKCGVVGDLVL